jgi:hypothetical protein
MDLVAYRMPWLFIFIFICSKKMSIISIYLFLVGFIAFLTIDKPISNVDNLVRLDGFVSQLCLSCLYLCGLIEFRPKCGFLCNTVCFKK